VFRPTFTPYILQFCQLFVPLPLSFTIQFILKKIVFLALTLLGCCACESDDLCDQTINTPRLVVRFYDPNNLRTPFSVSNLTVYGEGSSTPLVSKATLDSLALPLRLENPTTYLLETVVSGTITATATLTLSYTPVQTFVSKACGIRTYYTTLSATLQNPNHSWLKGLKLRNTTVDNEKKAHLHLYH